MNFRPGTKVIADVDGYSFTGKVSDTPATFRGEVAVDTDEETWEGGNFLETDASNVRRA